MGANPTSMRACIFNDALQVLPVCCICDQSFTSTEVVVVPTIYKRVGTEVRGDRRRPGSLAELDRNFVLVLFAFDYSITFASCYGSALMAPGLDVLL